MRQPSYDAIVVGTRCAGAPLAMLLARQGHRVLALDRATFPSDTLSTHVVKMTGGALLKKWGLLDAVLATGVPPFRTLEFDLGPIVLEGSPPPAGEVDFDISPRRHVLDTLLVRAAADAGAEIRERFTVRELIVDDGRVVGIRAATDGGRQVEERATIVVGADGMRSVVASSVAAPDTLRHPSLTCAYYAYWSGVPMDRVVLAPRPGRIVIAFPTHEDLTCVLVEWSRDQFEDVRGDIEAAVFSALDLVPSLSERVRAGARASRFEGIAELPNFFRRSSGPGWALVGDAGSHRDPITAEGIPQAFRDADGLAEAIHTALTTDRPLDVFVDRWAADRETAARPLFELTCEMARLAPPSPSEQALFGALASNPQEASRFFGVIVGTVPVQEFFAPENIARIVGKADPQRVEHR